MKPSHVTTLSRCIYFETVSDIPKGRVTVCPSAGLAVAAPIPLKAKDQLLFDMETRRLEKVVRDGITIWREAWKN
jgi:hypothetical protein